MTDPVFLVDALPAAGRFVLGGDEGRHAATVRRLRAGQRLELADGAGGWAVAVVVGASAGGLTVDAEQARYDEPPALRVTVAQALPKGDHSELAVDLATEAGVDRIIPWQATRCVARWDGAPDKAERGRLKWQRVAREAAKQARRHWIPEVAPLARTEDVAAAVSAADRALVLHEDGAVPLASLTLPAEGQLLIVVGPEGGITDEEIRRFTAAGATPVRLGCEVLRASAAAAVALGALGIMTGRWA